MNFFSHLNSAVDILKKYDGKEPFHYFIKKYLGGEKKYGSRDRKQISSLCYNYFRIGHAAKNISTADRIVLASFLCENKHSAFLEALKPEWNQQIEKPLPEKLSIVNQPAGSQGYQLSIDKIFPFADELSKGIDADKFNLSFLIQPKLFLRIRPGNENRVAGKLSGAGFQYERILEDCIALPNASKVDAIIELDKEAAVQDYNSQRVAEFMSVRRRPSDRRPPDRVWDCCAASGGKSIMAYDINPNIELTVSDKRQSILQNLHQRFAKAGIKNYNWFVADLTASPPPEGVGGRHDLIICDAPCTGSGTWARTPEQLFYFKKGDIEKYAALQKKIVENVIPKIKPGGRLLYITCSVFKKENEEVVKFIEEKFRLKLVKMELLKGYEIKADTMFAALFTAPLT